VDNKRAASVNGQTINERKPYPWQMLVPCSPIAELSRAYRLRPSVRFGVETRIEDSALCVHMEKGTGVFAGVRVQSVCWSLRVSVCVCVSECKCVLE
jgi:hypothetical protein